MDPELERHSEYQADDDAESAEEEASGRLLDRVVQETLNASSHDALLLIEKVASRSVYEDSTDLRAVMEVVRAIVDRRFGPGRIGDPLVRRVSASLADAPETCIRLERIWKEARNRG